MKPLLAFFFNFLALLSPFAGFFAGMALRSWVTTTWGHITLVFFFVIVGALFSVIMLMMKEILKGDF